MMLILSLAKHTVVNHEACRKGDWGIRDRNQTDEIAGKKLGIVGLGNIGCQIAQKAHLGFGMDIIGYDAYASWDTLPDYIERSDLGGICSTADIISLNVPLTPETKYMADSHFFADMKPGAWLINTSRGGVVNEADLFEALTTGHLGAAALDVFEAEPVSCDNRLLALPNFIASPHCAGLSREAEDRMCLSCAHAIDDALNGRLPQYPVNKLL